MQLWHITVSSVDRVTLFPDERQRRAAVRIFVRATRDLALLFCIVDDHVHVVVACNRELRPVLRGALVQALARASGCRLTAHVRPVEGRAHLMRLVGYLLDQTTRHRLGVHPASWSGSCFQDLVGARCIAPSAAREPGRALPRLRPDDLCRMAALPPSPLRPADRDALREAGPRRIAGASAAALALGPVLAGRTLEVARARRVTAQLAEHAGIRRADVAAALAVTPQRIGQLVAAPAEPLALRAARLQIAIEDLVGASARAGLELGSALRAAGPDASITRGGTSTPRRTPSRR